MAIENKKMILLEDIKGNREIAYALLEASHSLFLVKFFHQLLYILILYPHQV